MMVHGANHLLGYEATLQIPQVFPLASLTKPFSPQVVPQEFLTHQYWSVTPTKSTPWLREVLQLVKIPDLQGDQLVASTATDTGLPVMAVAKSLQFFTSVKPEILKLPEFLEQVCLTALQGYSDSRTIPWSLTNLKALSIRPPLQAWFPQEPEQSTSCCSEKLWRLPQATLERPSRPPVAEKAQQDPHCPWFLTSVTAPWSTQLTSPTLRSSVDSMLLEYSTTVPRQVWTNSSVVRPENWLRPISQVLNSLELWELILARFSRKILSLQAFSNSEAYLMLCLPFQDSNSETVEDCCTFRRTAAAPMTAMRTASCFPFIQFIMNLVTIPLHQYPQVGFLITLLKHINQKRAQAWPKNKISCLISFLSSLSLQVVRMVLSVFWMGKNQKTMMFSYILLAQGVHFDHSFMQKGTSMVNILRYVNIMPRRMILVRIRIILYQKYHQRHIILLENIQQATQMKLPSKLHHNIVSLHVQVWNVSLFLAYQPFLPKVEGRPQGEVFYLEAISQMIGGFAVFYRFCQLNHQNK